MLQLLYPRERDLSTHRTGGWESPRAGLSAVVKRKISGSARN
jgi:hypothetical protein